MAFAWNSIIAPEETIQKEFTVSLLYRKVVFAVVIILSVLAFFVSWYAALILLATGGIYWWYINTAKHYAMTNRRIVLTQSFLGQDVTSIDYNQITDIEVEQSVVDQIAHWGTIVINTAGTHTPQIRLTFIDRPFLIKQDLDQIRDTTTATPQPITPQQPQTLSGK